MDQDDKVQGMTRHERELRHWFYENDAVGKWEMEKVQFAVDISITLKHSGTGQRLQVAPLGEGWLATWQPSKAAYGYTKTLQEMADSIRNTRV